MCIVLCVYIYVVSRKTIVSFMKLKTFFLLKIIFNLTQFCVLLLCIFYNLLFKRIQTVKGRHLVVIYRRNSEGQLMNHRKLFDPSHDASFLPLIHLLVLQHKHLSPPCPPPTASGAWFSSCHLHQLTHSSC